MASVLQGTLFLIGLMSAAWTDLRRRQIYDLSGIVIAGAGLISFSPARLLGLALAVPFWLASRRGRGGMGDAVLIAASGFLLGFLRGAAGLVLALVLYCLFYLAISEAQAVLQATDKEERFPMLCAASLLLFAVGAGIAIIMNNLLLVPVLAAGMMFLPFWYIKLTAGHYRKAVTAELETALSIITTAYLRSEDLQTAVEENINYLNPPVQGVFRSFLTRIKHIDPDVNAALAELKSAIDNEVWREWCEALSACQYDHSMKSTLNPIVAKLSDMRIINGELENLVFAPRKEFISMAALVVLNIPLLYFLNKDWYAALMTTVPGKAVLAVCAAAIFVSFARVVKLTQPIEYRR